MPCPENFKYRESSTLATSLTLRIRCNFVQRNHPIHERWDDSGVLVKVPSLERHEKASAAGEVSRNVRQERKRASSWARSRAKKRALLSKLRGQQALRNCSTLTSLAINNSVQPQDVAVPDASYTREKLSSKCAPKGFHCALKSFPIRIHTCIAPDSSHLATVSQRTRNACHKGLTAAH